MTFIEYVEKVDHLIVEYTQKLSKETLDEIEKTIEDADANCGKIWLEDYIDEEYQRTQL